MAALELCSSFASSRALVFLPLASLYLALRKRPEGITGSSRTIDLALAEGSDALIGGGRHSWLLRLPGHDSFRFASRVGSDGARPARHRSMVCRSSSSATSTSPGASIAGSSNGSSSSAAAGPLT